MKRFFLFTLGSIVGAAIDFTIGLLLMWAELPGWLALALAMSVSATVVYIIHQKITFSDLRSRELHSGRLTAFLVNTVVIYALRVIVLEGLQLLGWVPSAALATALLASVALNFAISRLFIFN